MRITEIRTFLVDASRPTGVWRSGRNWLFVKVETDEGIYGVGEGSGWPRVVETAVRDLAPLVVGEDPFCVERIWQKMLLAMMGHGMTGVVGGGAMTAIEVACWDIMGKKLNVPVCDLLGGRVRDRIRVYGHAGDAKGALKLVEEGYTGVKTGSLQNPVAKVKEVREAVGPDVDVMIDVHGPPWFTTQDAIRVGQELEPYDILFYEDPVPPENVDALAKVAEKVNVPIAVGERHATIYGFREVIERGIADVIQPDMGRAGGLMQVKKACAMAEAHYVTVAPHDGSNGPIAEAAAVHLMATIPNFLILEHLAHDVPWRYEVATPLEVKDGHIEVPRGPGLGVDLDEEVAAAHPSQGNVTQPSEETLRATYYETRAKRGRLFRA